MNWLAIIAGAFVPLILGFIWYHKALFGSAWMKSLGLTEEDLKTGNMALLFGMSFLMAGVISYFIIQQLGIHDYIYSMNDKGAYPHNFGHGAFHGMFLGLLFAAPVLITNSLFERRNWANILINAGYWVACTTLIAGVVSLFM